MRVLLLFCLCSVILASAPAFAQTTPNDGDWKSNSATLKNTEEGDVMIRVGDIDNLGFGFPQGFNPFTGRSTEIHPYPWQAKKEDVPGLDRITVGSMYGKKIQQCGGDGY